MLIYDKVLQKYSFNIGLKKLQFEIKFAFKNINDEVELELSSLYIFQEI